MSRLRVCRRVLAVALLTGGWSLAWLLGLCFALALGRGEDWRAFVFGSWARGMARALGMQIERRGQPPGEPTLLVSNHLGYADIVLIASQMRCVFLSKSEVADWPVVGLLARWMQTLFVDRGRRRDVTRVGREIRERLERGQSVVLFPEGTSTGGDAVLPFRSALLEPAARGGWPVRTAALRYETPAGWPPARDVVCWWGDASFAPHVLRLFALPGFRARIAFGSRPLVDPDRKALARSLHEEVASRFGSLLEGEDQCPIGV